MTEFVYKGRDESGQTVNGRIGASNRDSAINKLQERRIILISLNEVKEAIDGEGLSMDMEISFGPKVKLEDLVLLTRQLYSLTKSGIPIVRAITGLAESTDNQELGKILKQIAQSLISGSELSVAFRQFPEIFSPIFVSLVHVGESTGHLDDAFLKLNRHLEMERETRKQVKQATRYPIMVISSISVALIAINVFVIPNFKSVFNKLGADLPFATQLLIATSEFMVERWYVLIIAFVVLIGGWLKYIHSEQGELFWHERKLKLPLLGTIFERIALSRFCRSLSMMLGSGVPILKALSVVSETVGNRFIGDAIVYMQKGVERGERLTSTAAQTQLFTPLVLQMMAVGEETGSVDELLNEVADFYEQEIEYELKQLADAIEPILLVFMGLLVLVLALGVFLPIWDLSTATKPG